MSLVKNKLIDKILKETKSQLLSKSETVHNKDLIPTGIPAFNIALSGSLKGGLTPGALMIVGESRTFKTLMMLLMAKAYLDKYEDACIIFYDCEFGASAEYFESVGIDQSRVVHEPFEDIEQLKIKMTKHLNAIERGEKVILIVDSLGMAASKNEAEDAGDGEDKADAGRRAKAVSSFARIITPKLTIKDVPLIFINHGYMEQKMFGKLIVKGGKQIFLAAQDIWIITRAKETEGTSKDLKGYSFNIRIEKSRNVVEQSIVPLVVRFDEGIDKYTGLLELAVECGMIVKPKMGYYRLRDDENAEPVKEDKTDPLIEKIIDSEEFNNFIESKYKLASRKLVNDVTDEISEEEATEEQ